MTIDNRNNHDWDDLRKRFPIKIDSIELLKAIAKLSDVYADYVEIDSKYWFGSYSSCPSENGDRGNSDTGESIN